MSALGNNTGETTEWSTETERLFADGVQEGEAVESLEVKWGLGLWEGGVELGLETVVGFPVAEEIVNEEGEDARSSVGTGLNSKE